MRTPPRRIAAAVWTAGVVSCLTAGPAAAQLPTASAAALGVGDNYSAAVVGFAAVGANPARLGLPSGPSWSLSIPSIGVHEGAHPVGLGDLDKYAGQMVPASQREEWLLEIARSGGQAGNGRVAITPIAASVGNVGIQLTTMVLANANLNEDAAELLLFGNAGRTGDPRDFELAGSTLDAAAFSTMAVGFGIPIPTERGIWMAGAGFTVAVGHAMILARDSGSLLRGDPVSVELEFPVIQTDTAFEQLNNGFGFGFDVGAAYEDGPWSLSAAVKNLVNVFEWDSGALFYRSGQALFDGDESDSDFEARPGSQAPSVLLEEVRGQAFDRRVELAAAYWWRNGVRLFGELRRRFGDGLGVTPKSHLGAGAELTARNLRVRAGGAVVSGGYQVGGGLGLVLGPVHADGSLLRMGGDAGEGMAVAVGLSFGAF